VKRQPTQQGPATGAFGSWEQEKMKLTHDKLIEALDYDPFSGEFIHTGNTNKRVAGKVAGFLSGKGYVQISICDVAYLAHRLAWFYVNAEWPQGHIDHINGIKSDNRIRNLRCASPQENNFNLGVSTRNTTGFKGVSKSGEGSFRAAICKDRESVHLGIYRTAVDAAKAYDAAAVKLHGDFARTNKSMGLL
jgi:hypothetical protein